MYTLFISIIVGIPQCVPSKSPGHFNKAPPSWRWTLNFCLFSTKSLQKILLYFSAIFCLAPQPPACYGLASAHTSRLAFLSLSSLCNLDYLNSFSLGNTKLQFFLSSPVNLPEVLLASVPLSQHQESGMQNFGLIPKNFSFLPDLVFSNPGCLCSNLMPSGSFFFLILFLAFLIVLDRSVGLLQVTHHNQKPVYWFKIKIQTDAITTFNALKDHGFPTMSGWNVWRYV